MTNSRRDYRAIPLTDGRALAFPHVLVMGIINATPDSFSDGGEVDDPVVLERRLTTMLDSGVDAVDIGGESTRPAHTPVPTDVEMSRVLPVIGLLRRMDGKVPISIDTRKAHVAQAALVAGASFVNDVSGLSDPAMASVIASSGCGYVAMRTADCTDPIVDSCRNQLAQLMERAIKAGIPETSIILDPGLGFGTRPGASVEDNLALVDAVEDYSFGRPVLIGASRKRFVGAMSGENVPRDRVASSVAVAVRAARAGAAIVRVHDVPETIVALADNGLRSGQ
jgi:dihydropteroate synthase